jgi:stearoyl-CoA desaturase (delta-9 desaturase)
LMPGKTSVDVDTLKAVITNRFQVMANYSKEVIMPVLQEERRRAGEKGQAMLNRIRKLLIRETSLVKPENLNQLTTVLEQHQMLKVVYQFRLTLQNIWARSTATQKELVEALQEWCRQAEATGIEALREFVKHIKAYVPQQA